MARIIYFPVIFVLFLLVFSTFSVAESWSSSGVAYKEKISTQCGSSTPATGLCWDKGHLYQKSSDTGGIMGNGWHNVKITSTGQLKIIGEKFHENGPPSGDMESGTGAEEIHYDNHQSGYVYSGPTPEEEARMLETMSVGEEKPDPHKWYNLGYKGKQVKVKGSRLQEMYEDDIESVNRCEGIDGDCFNNADDMAFYEEARAPMVAVVDEAFATAELEVKTKVAAEFRKADRAIQGGEKDVGEKASQLIAGLYLDMAKLDVAASFAQEKVLGSHLGSKINLGLFDQGVDVGPEVTRQMIERAADSYASPKIAQAAALALQINAWVVALHSLLPLAAAGGGVAVVGGTGTTITTKVISNVVDNMDAVVNSGIALAKGDYVEAGVEAGSAVLGKFFGESLKWGVKKLAQKVVTEAVEEVVEEGTKIAAPEVAKVVSAYTGELAEESAAPIGSLMLREIVDFVAKKQTGFTEQGVKIIAKGALLTEKAVVHTGAEKGTAIALVALSESLHEGELEEDFFEGSCLPGESCESDVPEGVTVEPKTEKKKETTPVVEKAQESSLSEEDFFSLSDQTQNDQSAPVCGEG